MLILGVAIGLIILRREKIMVFNKEIYRDSLTFFILETTDISSAENMESCRTNHYSIVIYTIIKLQVNDSSNLAWKDR